MPNIQQCIEASQVLLDSSTRFKALGFGQELIHPLLDACSILVMRHQLGPNRPPVIGFIGCTGTGKSTLFNSLIGRAVSSTSWHAHNTSGAVLVADPAFQHALLVSNTTIFPSLTHKTVNPGQPGNAKQPIKGSPSELIVCILQQTLDAVFLDLPDINTTKARADNRVSLQLLPWLDTAVFLTDDETVYHKDYEEPVSVSESLKQNRICALVNRGSSQQVDLEHRDLVAVRDFFSVKKIVVLPNLDGKPNYTNEPEFVSLKQEIVNTPLTHDPSPMLGHIAGFATSLMDENQTRLDMLADTAKELQKTIDSCVSKPIKIPLNKILQDEVLHVLHHLGLKRFAVSNILRFFKSTLTTGAVRRSFKLAFGEQRGTTLDTMLKFDTEKLIDETAVFLSDYGEEIDQTLRQSQHAAALFQTAPEFRELTQPLSQIKEQPEFKTKVAQILQSFEQECRDLLQSDSIKDSVKNDPVVSVSVMIMLITDILTIPGIGTFLLVPSAFSFLPMGKFEKAKKNFQRNIRDLIQAELLQLKSEFERQKGRFILDPSERAWKALQTCSAFKEKQHAH